MRESWLEIEDLRVHAVAWGEDSAARRVLLVHGLGGSTINWERVGAPLAEKLGASVTAVDLAGFGLTRLPHGRHATLRTNGHLLHRVLADHVGPATVVGNSMGGTLAVGLAARHPDLVRALVLVDPAVPQAGGGLPDWRVITRFAPLTVPPLGRWAVGRRSQRLGPAGLVDQTLALTFAHPERVPPEIRERLIARAAERASFPEAASAYVDAARALLFHLQLGMPADLERVRCPTLLVHGARDPLVPLRAAQRVANRRPDFMLEVIEDCGHVPQLERPDRFLAIVVPWPTTAGQATAEAAAPDA
jgi:pimeloyl-ACP methyl ester carboxylesterase